MPAESAALLERGGARQQATLLLEQLAAGRGGVLFVLGTPGLGTSSLLRWVADAGASVAQVGCARGDALEAALPYELVAPIVAECGGGDIVEETIGPRTVGVTRSARFHRIVARLRSTTQPLLLVLDDVHWADRYSLRLLSFVARRIGELPVAIVAGARLWPATAERLCLALACQGHATIERLQPLSCGAATEVVSTWLGGPVPTSVAQRAWALTAGNPLLLTIVAEAMAAGEDIEADVDRWLRRGAGALLLHRFVDLPRSGRSMLQAAAVLGDPFCLDMASKLAGLTEAECGRALEAIGRTGLISSSTDGGLWFAYPIVREAILADVSPLGRRRLHSRALSLLSESGHRALGEGAVRVAAAHLTVAVDLACPNPGAEDRVALAEALLATGRWEAARGVCEHLMERPELDLGAAAQLLLVRGQTLAAEGNHEGAMVLFREAAERGGVMPPTSVDALVAQALTGWFTSGVVGALRCARRAVRMAGRSGGPGTHRARAVVELLSCIAGAPQRSMATGPGDPWQGCVGTGGWVVPWGMATRAMLEERLEEADVILARALAVPRWQESPEATARLSVARADVLVRRGHPETALGFASTALDLSGTVPAVEPLAAAVNAWALLQVGRLDEADRSCERLAAAADPADSLALLWWCHLRGTRLLRDGGHRESSDLYLRAGELSRRLEIEEPCLVPWSRPAVVAHLIAGRGDRVQPVIRWLQSAARSLPCRWPRASAESSLGLLALQEGEQQNAAAHLDAARRLLDGVDLPMERVELLVDHARLLEMTGQRERSRSMLHAALRLANAQGAAAAVDRVHSSLLQAGGRLRRRAADAGTLTESEDRVAGLAAEGSSNREIARRLGVSVSTIETHLERIYRKLSIHSRRELMMRARLTA